MYSFKQGDLSVTDYLTRMKIFWDELDNFRPIPQCTYANPCKCDALTTMRTYRQNQVFKRS